MPLKSSGVENCVELDKLIRNIREADAKCLTLVSVPG
jgi:hypothetical protein